MYNTIAEMKAANTNLGHSWFSKSGTDYHGSRVETDVIGGYYFVESAYKVPGDESSGRCYKPAVCDPNGAIRYLGIDPNLDQYADLDSAIARINAVLEMA